MINTSCPLCAESEKTGVAGYEQIGPEELGCRLVRCRACGHAYTEVPEEVDLEQLYGGGTYAVLDTRGSLSDRIKDADHRIVLRQLRRLRGRGGSLLDLGCGKGQFIYGATADGWTVKGIETAADRAKFGVEEYGLDVSTEEYRSGAIAGGPFDVITLFHVLEHLPRPAHLLRALLADNLAEGGYLVLEVPLFESLQSRLAGKHWLHLDPPLHLSHFNKQSLIKLLAELDLEPKRVEYFSLQHGVLGMVQSLMSLLGYKKMIISELKFNRTWRLLSAILLVLPIAGLLELLGVVFRRGSVIRVYCTRTPPIKSGA